jgi:hypothetical protein
MSVCFINVKVRNKAIGCINLNVKEIIKNIQHARAPGRPQNHRIKPFHVVIKKAWSRPGSLGNYVD